MGWNHNFLHPEEKIIMEGLVTKKHISMVAGTAILGATGAANPVYRLHLHVNAGTERKLRITPAGRASLVGSLVRYPYIPPGKGYILSLYVSHTYKKYFIRRVNSPWQK